MRMGRCGNFPRMSDPAGRRILWVPAATSATADEIFHPPADHLTGTTDPGGQAGNRRATYAGQEALYKASSQRGEVAGVSPDRANSPDQEWGVRMDERGGRRRIVSAAAGAKVSPILLDCVHVSPIRRPDSRAADIGGVIRGGRVCGQVYSPGGGIRGIRAVSTAIGWATRILVREGHP